MEWVESSQQLKRENTLRSYSLVSKAREYILLLQLFSIMKICMPLPRRLLVDLKKHLNVVAKKLIISQIFSHSWTIPELSRLILNSHWKLLREVKYLYSSRVDTKKKIYKAFRWSVLGSYKTTKV